MQKRSHSGGEDAFLGFSGEFLRYLLLIAVGLGLIAGVWFWLDRSSEPTSLEYTMADTVADNTAVVSSSDDRPLNGRPGVRKFRERPTMHQISGPPPESEEVLKARALRVERDAIGKEIRQLPGEYQAIVEHAVASRPQLGEIYDEREALDDTLDQELGDPRLRDLQTWSAMEKVSFAKGLAEAGITDPNDLGEIKKHVESEVGRIRQFYFLHEMDRLLSDAQLRDSADAWLRGRLDPSELDREFYSVDTGRSGLFNSFREFSDAVVPNSDLLREFLDQPNRQERVMEVVDNGELDMIDSSIPIGVEDQIGKLTALGMRRTILEQRLQSEIPELQALERRRRELLLGYARANEDYYDFRDKTKKVAKAL